MDNQEFSSFRQKLQKTQKEMAELLGTSLKTVQSFEQGWRKVPVHIERQVLFLLNMKKGKANDARPCWVVQNCSVQARQGCPAWEFNAGSLCWFINGTICESFLPNAGSAAAANIERTETTRTTTKWFRMARHCAYHSFPLR